MADAHKFKDKSTPSSLAHHDRRDDNNNHQQCIIRLHRKCMLLAMNLLSDGNFAKMGEFVEMR